MSLYSRARKHIDMNRVKKIREDNILEQIALQEKQYLLYFTQNTVPKYYDWRTGEYNNNPLSEINDTIEKRLEEIEDALSEGMTTRDFKHLYGGVVTHDIVSLNPNLVSSTFAHDLISASSEVTSHMFGPDFPGSHINSIGDFKPQSYSKVDVLATASWNSLQDVTPSGWTPENSYEYYDSVSDVVSSGQETDIFKDTYFGEVTTGENTISISTGDDEDSSQQNTVNILDLESLFPGVTFPTGHPMPDGTEPEDPMEASMLLRTFKSIKVGQEISFNYSFTSTETEENPEYITYRGVSDTAVPGEDANMDDYAFVLIAGRVQKIVSVMAKDGNNLDFNFQGTDADGNPVTTEFKPDILQSRFPLTGKYSYTVRQDDIDDHGNLKLFIGVMDVGDDVYETNLDITDFELDRTRSAAGQLGQTTDAFDLGYRAETPAELRKRLQSSEVASDIEKLGTQAKTYIDYLTGNLPDTIDNEYLGQKYVNSIFKDAFVNNKGKITVGDNVVGTGGEATYDPKTGQITIPFNYDFNTNAQEIAKNPERFGNSAFDKTVRAIAAILGGDYALDSIPVVPAGHATALAKLLGGAKHRPGKVTMSADKVNKLNPLLHAQVVGTTGLAKEELYPGQPSPNGFPDTPPPKMARNGYHPDFGRRADRYRRLDPISAKTMNMVGTDDPQTNKQVASAADSKPKKLPSGAVKKYAKRNVVKKESNNPYARSRKYIDMNRVKQLREKEITQEKIADTIKQQEELLVEVKKIEMKKDPKFSNWRRDLENINEFFNGMTSSGMFVTSTLDATGDAIQTDIPRDSASDLRYNIGDAVTVSDGAIRFGEVAPNGYSSTWWTQSAGTNFIRTTDEIGTKKVTHVTFNVDVGTGIDAPLPEHPLTIKYQMRTSSGFNAGTGTLGTISSSGLHSFELPEFHEFYEISFDLDVEGTYNQLYQADYQRRMFVGTTLAGATITQADTVSNIGPAAMIHDILHHPGPFDDDADTTMHVLLFNGFSSRISGLPGGSGGGLGSDRVYLYNLIRSQYAHLKNRYAKTYTINSLGLTRRTPITVFTALDTPDASAFVRDGDYDRLSPADKKKKLEEQLAASKEYLDKMFGEGMPGTATEIADYEPQKSFADIALDTIPYEPPSPGPGGYKPPGSYDPNKFYDLKTDPSQLPSPNLPSTGPGRSSVPDGTEVAANQGPSTPVKYDSDMKQYVPNPGGGRPKNIRLKGKAKMFAQHEPQGEVIKEKKTFKDLTKKIPGYYDGKPSPLGFPVEEPPKMKNGYHPDLVDGKKVAQRFNRLDPISARAMPKTGNPHIDKKVRAAAKKPK